MKTKYNHQVMKFHVQWNAEFLYLNEGNMETVIDDIRIIHYQPFCFIWILPFEFNKEFSSHCVSLYQISVIRGDGFIPTTLWTMVNVLPPNKHTFLNVSFEWFFYKLTIWLISFIGIGDVCDFLGGVCGGNKLDDGGVIGCTFNVHSFELRFGDILAGKLSVLVHWDKLLTILL